MDWKGSNNTIQIQTEQYLRHRYQRQQDVQKKYKTYRGWDLCGGGKQEPNDTLTNQEHVSRSQPQQTDKGIAASPPDSKGGARSQTCQRRDGAGEAVQRARLEVR